ncbi:MAG: site-specific DNA-methyltransferase [Caldilinea sp. CFX5]|nr:site-specific DNA-methyltransferase [Caldilinea sp. CFX5]
MSIIDLSRADQIDLLKTKIESSLRQHRVAILPPLDVKESMILMQALALNPRVTMLDPWYNKGFGEIRDDYNEYILTLLDLAAPLSEHIFLWGFPEIVAYFVDKLPPPLSLIAWLTWYYKNNPSVIRGWRSSQNACLHIGQPNAKLYPEHFLNEAQQAKLAQGKLRYMPGPTSVIEGDFSDPADVIEAALLVGFVGKREQTGHPSQKPVIVFERLIAMTTLEGNLVFDPMCGSGTTAAAARKLGRLAIVTDHCEDYIQIVEQRLQVSRISLNDSQTTPNGLLHKTVAEQLYPIPTQNGAAEQHIDQLRFDWEPS